MLVIRHLPTPYNAKGLLQGSLDISCNTESEFAKNQREQFQNHSLKTKFDKVIISELKRTKETAEFFGFQEFVMDKRINEINFGHFEGKPKAEMLHLLGNDWFEKFESLEDRFGEKISSFKARIADFYEEHYQSNILVFSHGAVMRALIALHQTKSLNLMNKVEVKNGELIDFNTL